MRPKLLFYKFNKIVPKGADERGMRIFCENRDGPKTIKLVEDAFINYLLIADDLHHPALVTWEVLHYYDKSLV